MIRSLSECHLLWEGSNTLVLDESLVLISGYATNWCDYFLYQLMTNSKRHILIRMITRCVTGGGGIWTRIMLAQLRRQV